MQKLFFLWVLNIPLVLGCLYGNMPTIHRPMYQHGCHKSNLTKWMGNKENKREWTSLSEIPHHEIFRLHMVLMQFVQLA